MLCAQSNAHPSTLDDRHPTTLLFSTFFSPLKTIIAHVSAQEKLAICFLFISIGLDCLIMPFMSDHQTQVRLKYLLINLINFKINRDGWMNIDQLIQKL